jgi:ubiquinone/menaquinone biosynthesis C-methylase UbiE
MRENRLPEELKSNIIHNRVLAVSYGLAINNTYAQYLKYLLLEQNAHEADECLDIGIANGLYAIPLSARVKHIHGVDISPDMLAECQRNLQDADVQNITLHEQSATQLGFESESFDLVYCYSTLLLVPDINRALNEITRVLKPTGTAILDITGKHNLSRIHWSRYYWRQAQLKIHSYTLADIEAIFKHLELETVERHATGFLDQWKYIWGIKYLRLLNRLVHETRYTPDRDYRVSQRFPRLANRWYFVLRKMP